MRSEQKVLTSSSQLLYAEESTVYIVPSKLTSIGVGKNKIEQLLQVIVDAGFPYRIYDKVDLPAEIATRCGNLKTTIIFSYFLPDIGDYNYYIVNLSAIDDVILKNILNNVKQCTWESRRNALINIAYNAPELLEKVIRNGMELNEYSSECCICRQPSKTSFKQPIFRGRPSSKESEEISLKEIATLMKRFLHNVRKYKEENDAVAKKEIDIILNNSVGVSDKLWETVFSSMLSDKSQKEFFKVCIDRYTLGKRATIKVKVKQEDDNNKVKRNHGKYYVAIEQGGEKEDIKLNFKNQPTAVIYIMYLIDRKQKGNMVDRLNIQKNMNEFKRLYNAIYGEYTDPAKIESHLKNIINEEVEEDGRITLKTGRLKLYYDDISEILDKKMVKTENPLPYKVNARTHLTIPRENIEIPDELLNFNFS